MKLPRLRNSKPAKSQSLVELAIILPVLLIIMTGVIEFGNLLNQYINVVDAAREGARFGSNNDPFIRTVVAGCASPFCDVADFYTGIDQIVEGAGTPEDSGALDTILLSDANGDDVVISVFSIVGASKTVTRFPIVSSCPTLKCWSKYGNEDSAFSNAQMEARLRNTAPDTGMLLVEIFYHYGQILKMPFFTVFVPDPIRVHTYSIMPLSAAEPTPTH